MCDSWEEGIGVMMWVLEEAADTRGQQRGRLVVEAGGWEVVEADRGGGARDSELGALGGGLEVVGECDDMMGRWTVGGESARGRWGGGKGVDGEDVGAGGRWTAATGRRSAREKAWKASTGRMSARGMRWRASTGRMSARGMRRRRRRRGRRRVGMRWGRRRGGGRRGVGS